MKDASGVSLAVTNLEDVVEVTANGQHSMSEAPRAYEISKCAIES